jgi:hypothetical protein
LKEKLEKEFEKKDEVKKAKQEKKTANIVKKQAEQD